MINTRKIFGIVFLLCLMVIPIKAQNTVCHIGLKYQISNDHDWGNGYPVVIMVKPYSAAQKAGVRLGDIIEKIDGVSTQNLDINQINQLLQSDKSKHLLNVVNYGGQRSLLLIPECSPVNQINEEDLSSAFAFYSLRDANDRVIMYPIKFTAIDSKILEQAQTFAFAASDGTTAAQDSIIYGQIERLLYSRGLHKDVNNPDIIFNINYSLQKVDSTIELDGIIPYSYRFNFTTNTMDRLPIMSIGVPRNAAQYTINFGLDVFSGKDKSQILWSSTCSDLLSAPLSIPKYASYMLPIMLRTFPFIATTSFPIYKFSTRHFNYTGISYKIGDLSKISEVKDDSPAFDAGIMPGDIIRQINGVDFPLINSKAFSAEYIKFIQHTDGYRQPISQAFTDAHGISNCRFWDSKYYNDINRVFNSDKYNTIFSYLFFFRPYINNTKHREIVFGITRNGKNYLVMVKPIERNFVSIIPE